MKKVTYISILCRAINDVTRAIRREAEMVARLKEDGRTADAEYAQRHLVAPLEAELETLKTLYTIETGTDY